MSETPNREETPMNAVIPAAAADAALWKNYKMTADQLEHFEHVVSVAWDHVSCQSDAWRFGFCASGAITMAQLLERVDPGAADRTPEVADALTLAACSTTDQIAAWVIAHGRAPAGDVSLVRDFAWSHGIGVLCGYVYHLNYMLRQATGQMS